MPKDRINNLKADILIEGALKIVQNSQCLCDEAALLHKHNMYARSYALSHFAREEFAKSLMLYKVTIEVLSGNKVDWKKLDRRFRDHKEKIVNDRFLAYVLADLEKLDPKIRFNSGTINYTNHRKNSSLYVDWENGKFVSPKESVTERQSYRNLEIAKYQISSLSGVVLSLPELAKMPKEKILELFPMDKIMEIAEEFQTSYVGYGVEP